MTRLVSVITPVHGPSVPYLREAYASLRDQMMPDGWDWQWLVQEDGRDGLLEAAGLPKDDRISVGSGRHGGPGVARTLALARAEGELVKVLDADDMLTPDAIGRDVRALRDNPSSGWTTSRVLDLLADGSTVGFDQDPSAGALPRGFVLRHWLDHAYRAPVHPATLCIRRELLLALGGWMALPASEDTGLLLAADAVSAGYFSAEVGLIYRKWAGQVTAQGAHADLREQNARRTILQRRAEAAQNWSWPTTAGQ